MQKELYVFSNQIVRPVSRLKESVIEEGDYTNLSLYADEKVAYFPSYTDYVNGVSCFNDLDRLIEALGDSYEYVHVYELKDVTVNKFDEEVGHYEYKKRVSIKHIAV